MVIKIKSYNRADGELAGTMEKSLLEYMGWFERAVKRGYKVENTGYGHAMVYGGEGTKDFLVGVEDWTMEDWTGKEVPA